MKSYLHYASGFFDIFGIKHLMNNQTKVVHQATMAGLGTEHWPLHKVKRVRKPAAWLEAERREMFHDWENLDWTPRIEPMTAKKTFFFKSYLTVDPNSIQFNFLRIQTCFTKSRSYRDAVNMYFTEEFMANSPENPKYKCIQMWI